MGAGGFARTSEPPINKQNVFAKSAGGSSTQDRLETFPPLRSSDREPLAISGSEFFGRTPGAPTPDNTPSEDKKKKSKRLLLLLLLLLITFTAAFFGLGGMDLLNGSDEHVMVTESKTVAPAATTIETPTTIAEAIPVAEKETEEKVATPTTAAPVEDDHLPAEVIEPAMIPARISDVKMPETQYNISYPEPIAPPAVAVKAKTNFVAFELNVKLSEDPDTRVFSMVPSSGDVRGTASLAWSTLTGAVLFRCKGLEGNKAGSNYVLYYIDENDKAQRMMSFAVASGAELMLVPPRIPSRGVKRVVLTLEKTVKTLEGPALSRTEVLYSDYKEKAILTKPLK
jgi:hypothetical protein